MNKSIVASLLFCLFISSCKKNNVEQNLTSKNLKVIAIAADTQTISNRHAILQGQVVEINKPVEKVGFIYSLNNINDTNNIVGGGIVYLNYFTTNFNFKVNNLFKNTLYNFKAFAIDGNGIVFSEQLNFKTKALGTIPNLQLGYNFTATHFDFKCNAIINDDGGEMILEKGFVYGLVENPTINDNKKIVYGAFQDTLTNLKSESKYYFKAYAITNAGVGYSQQDTFRTQKNLQIIR